MTEAGTDSVTSYSDGLEYSASGASDWQYDDFDDGDSVQASGSGSTESDVDIYGTYYSDADSGPDHSVTYSTDTASEWDGSATDTGDTVDAGRTRTASTPTKRARSGIGERNVDERRGDYEFPASRTKGGREPRPIGLPSGRPHRVEQPTGSGAAITRSGSRVTTTASAVRGG